jgi:hypothetical protein
MSDDPGWPSKIIPFARPATGIKRAPDHDIDAFPRFHRESSRPNPPATPIRIVTTPAPK